MYICSECGKTYNNRHQFMGHCGGHTRKKGVKNPVVFFCLHCSKENQLGHLKPGAKTPKYCDAICWRAHQAALKSSRIVRWTDGTLGNISYGELEKLKSTQVLCEICSMEEVGSSASNHQRPNRLAADHDHETGKFRGLLCIKCNIQLGWFEKYKDQIKNYLEKPQRQ